MRQWFGPRCLGRDAAPLPLNFSVTKAGDTARMNTGSTLAHGGDLTYRIIGLAMRVHRRLGPGLLESAYQCSLCHELSQAGIAFEEQVPVPIRYGEAELTTGYLADIVVRGESWNSRPSSKSTGSTRRNR